MHEEEACGAEAFLVFRHRAYRGLKRGATTKHGLCKEKFFLVADEKI